MNQIRIDIDWQGPFSWDEVLGCNGRTDYGVYQIVGQHLVYGSDVLLYIGKAADQTFGTRIGQHNYRDWSHGPVSIHLGRLCGPEQLENTVRTQRITVAERLLIFSHGPAWNSSNLNDVKLSDFESWHVMNWGQRKYLLPEVSGVRWNINGHTKPATHSHYHVQP